MASDEVETEPCLTNQQKECLSTLCLLPRTWISRSISASYELRGVQMYEHFSQAIETIKKMEQKQSHPLLERLKQMLVNSLKDQVCTYEDLKKAHCFLGQLSDILYGAKQEIAPQEIAPQEIAPQKQSLRPNEQHRKEHTAEQIQQQVEQLIKTFKQNNKKRSSLCREIIRNFENTYDNWKSNIFTCYEHDFIPNDNNALESNHNKVKRVIRKITGNKSTARPLLVYGEEFVLSQSFFDKTPDDFLFALSEVDFDVVATLQAKLKVKQKKRGLKSKLLRQTKAILNKVLDDW